jgi:hypothetical protein
VDLRGHERPRDARLVGDVLDQAVGLVARPTMGDRQVGQHVRHKEQGSEPAGLVAVLLDVRDHVGSRPRCRNDPRGLGAARIRELRERGDNVFERILAARSHRPRTLPG